MNETGISKIQVAQRHIDAGIWMLFRNDDSVAIHTVAMAGFQILRDLAKQRGIEHTMDSMIRPGKEAEFCGSVKSFSNFFKHADRDPTDLSSGFREETNDSLLLIAVSYYDLLGCQRTEEMQALAAWYMSLHPDVLSQGVYTAMLPLFLELSKIQPLPREEHLAIGLTVLKRLKQQRLQKR